jgi:hypothetical protein
VVHRTAGRSRSRIIQWRSTRSIDAEARERREPADARRPFSVALTRTATSSPRSMPPTVRVTELKKTKARLQRYDQAFVAALALAEGAAVEAALLTGALRRRRELVEQIEASEGGLPGKWSWVAGRTCACLVFGYISCQSHHAGPIDRIPHWGVAELHAPALPTWRDLDVQRWASEHQPRCCLRWPSGRAMLIRQVFQRQSAAAEKAAERQCKLRETEGRQNQRTATERRSDRASGRLESILRRGLDREAASTSTT